MKVAITAASGKLGTAIVKQLIGEISKENIIGIDLSLEKAAGRKHILWENYFNSL